MTNEQTNEGDTAGKETIDTLAGFKTPEVEKSIYDKTLELVERQEKANSAALENLKQWQDFEAKRALGGVSGGGIPQTVISEEMRLKQEAAEFLKEQ